ncbi:MAG: DUF309 domain-containing protein [Desulforhopalus sp.]|nr:DUF309 domain-containing protein [Desulforhopalus sp.]
MTNQLFNPFEDRLSRDIRNNLSEGLAESVETGNSDKLTQIVEYYRQQPFADYYRDYLEDRYTRYKQALTIIRGGITDPIHQGLVLWNLGLFFEVHEVLEHVWYSAEGNMKMTLQALIRAAGVYIKREYGFNDSANRIAAKAIPVLEENQDILEVYFKTEKLVSALKNPEVLPPILS